MGYERSNIAAMRGYVPGKQLASRDIIKLNSNENPHPPCAAVMQALAAIGPDALRRYPPPAADGFRHVAAKLHGLTLEQVVAVNGGDELLRMAITTFVEPGAPIGVVDPSYSLYPVLAAIHGSPIVGASSGADWAPPHDLAARMNDAGVKLLFLVNPHAPSGQLTPPATIAGLARDFHGVLLVDEAYVDFVDPELHHDVVPLLREHDNIMILRSMSKGYSLAGLRFGYGLGAASLVEPLLWKTRDSYNVDVIAQHLATTSLEHRSEAAKTWRAVRDERARVSTSLQELGFSVYPSQANFVLAYVPQGTAALALQQGLEQQGVLVRHFTEPRLDNALRISIGTAAENARLLAALRSLLAARQPAP
jgi:histidinol-phosphate aminotransferase